MVLDKLLSLNSSKATGPDNLHPYLLKSCARTLYKPVFLIIQQSLTTGQLPNFLKSANVTPIFKKGNKLQASNYRPISLTSQIVKLAESIIYEQLWEFLLNNGLSISCQHGFVNKKSCFTNLLDVYNDWTLAVDQGYGVDVIYLDYKKAFESVPHCRLMRKLKAYGIDGTLLLWFENYLSGRMQ